MRDVNEAVFRAPGSSLPLLDLMRRALREATAEQCAELAAHGAVQVAGRSVRRLERSVAPGARVTVAGERLGLAPEPPERSSRFLALVPAPAWRRGVLDCGEDSDLCFSLRDERGGVAELDLACGSLRVGAVLDALARAGFPALADARRGGILVAGGTRLRPLCDGGATEPAEDWWPLEPVFPQSTGEAGELPSWRVSAATTRVLRRGHPWILADDDTEDAGGFRPGTLVSVSGSQGKALGLARIEGAGRLAARVWASGARRAREAQSVEARVAQALARRRELMRRGEARSLKGGEVYTDAMRLIHGEADGLAGLAVDRLGGLLRVLVSGRACAGLLDRVVNAVQHGFADQLGAAAPVVEVLHLVGAPSRRLECVRLARGDDEALAKLLWRDGSRLCVHERGLCYLVDPGLAEPQNPRPGFGLYLDQRENRERVARFARRGGRWLNLFAHTGAFSVSLLAAGAAQVVSVDLSAAYLRWLEQNLELNSARGVDVDRHHSVRRDGRRFLSELAPGEVFDGIVLDPPTAAAAGRGYWSVQRDLEPLVVGALQHLAPGGVLLLCRNERAARRPLEHLLERAAERAAVRLADLQPAGPAADFPRLKGFPEGDAFSGVIARRA